MRDEDMTHPEEDWEAPTDITEDVPNATAKAEPPEAGFSAFSLEIEEEDDEAESVSLIELGADDLVMLDDIVELDELPLCALRDLGSGKSFLLVEDQTVLGGSGSVPVKGSVLESAAEIVATDTGHTLRNIARRTVVKFDGHPVAEHTLQPGDRFEVAKSSFIYELA